MRARHYLLSVTLLIAILLAACSPQYKVSGHNHPMATLADLPGQIQAAPVTVRESYQFAVLNPEVLSQIPCYCGCGAMGHKSNYDCYIAGAKAGGEIAFDDHALGCSICVDITQDTMRMLDAGRELRDIQREIDIAYARFGPPTTP